MGFSCTNLHGKPTRGIFGTSEARFCVLDLLAPHSSLLLASCVKSTTYARFIALSHGLLDAHVTAVLLPTCTIHVRRCLFGPCPTGGSFAVICGEDALHGIV
mmetsp:Transcript_9549/g.33845  ORF Transcript_9549/g.33845 Transcript_9549/m.33845 type:complete len:102 (+) Transcript_9549:661-966(+)